MSLIDTDNFNPLALEWLLLNIEFSFAEGQGCKSPVIALPCVVRERINGLWLCRWRLPLLGDGNADFLLATEMGIGFIKALDCGQADEEDDELDSAPYNMVEIFEAMQRGRLSFSSDHALGFFSVVESFMECALNHPHKFERLRTRLRRLTGDKLRERCKCILAGQVPPDIFSDDAS